MVQKPSKLQPAIVGGVILGLLSSIPIINFGNVCCCLWVLLGGAIAARMLINRSPYMPVTSGEGAAVGALAGVVGSLVSLVIGVPLALMMGEGMTISMLERVADVVNDPQAREQIREAIEQMQRQSAGQSMGQRLLGQLFFWFIGAVITVGFAALGGIIGVALFEKRKGQQPPGGYPPQQSSPNQPPYGY